MHLPCFHCTYMIEYRYLFTNWLFQLGADISSLSRLVRKIFKNDFSKIFKNDFSKKLNCSLWLVISAFPYFNNTCYNVFWLIFYSDIYKYKLCRNLPTIIDIILNKIQILQVFTIIWRSLNMWITASKISISIFIAQTGNALFR